MVELIGGGSVINGALTSSSYDNQVMGIYGNIKVTYTIICVYAVSMVNINVY